jgi:hypothetical protein
MSERVGQPVLVRRFFPNMSPDQPPRMFFYRRSTIGKRKKRPARVLRVSESE